MYDQDYEEWGQMEEDRKAGEALRKGSYTEQIDENTSVTVHGQPPGLIKWTTKDSGKRFESPDGMVRDTSEGKPQFALLFPKDVPFEDQLMTRVADLYHRGGVRYGPRNWEKSSTEESLAKHEDCLMRHVIKFLLGVEDGEDHAAAVGWNVNAVDLTRRKIRESQVDAALDKLTPQATAEPRPLNHDPLDFAAGSYSGPPKDFPTVEFENGAALLDNNYIWWFYAPKGGKPAWSQPSSNGTFVGSAGDLAEQCGPLMFQSGAYAGITMLRDGSLRWG